MLHNVKHHSDVRFVESWLGTFFDYVDNLWSPLKMNYDQMIEYCHNLKFDAAIHCEDAEYSKAFVERHKTMKFTEPPKAPAHSTSQQ